MSYELSLKLFGIVLPVVVIVAIVVAAIVTFDGNIAYM
jgi:hypothetical protein